MNIFCIPSWYPSITNPVYGIFIKEEIELIARYSPDDRFGVSLWGQGDERFLLWASEPIKSILKFNSKPASTESRITDNLKEYFQPAHTWTRRLGGNFKRIIRANQQNLQKFQKEHGPVDLIHVEADYPGSLIAEAISETNKIPYIITSHMSPFPFDDLKYTNGQIKPWLRRSLEKAQSIVATSSVAEQNIKSHGFKNTEIIPIARDLEYFIPGRKGDGDNVRILVIGRLVEQKGIDILLESMRDIEWSYELRIGGGGELENRLKQKASLNRVSVSWLGELTREEVLKEMQACDFLVLPSRHETFGNVLVEAAACGKPVVSTRCGGPEDIINHEIGIICAPEDRDDLKRSIIEMRQNFTKYDPEKVRKSVVDRFHPRLIAAHYRSIYQNSIR
jgi:glycosyltransferase involved in cell wall biosynthesis